MEPIDIYSKIQPLIQKEISNSILKHTEESRFTVENIPAHSHTGTDSNRVDFSDVENRFFLIPAVLNGALPATAANYGVVFIAPFPCILEGVKESHQTAGTNAGAVTVSIEKLVDGEALDSGVELITPIDLKGTTDTVVDGVLTQSNSYLNLATGDRLALKDAGTLTSVAGLCIILKIKY